MLVVGVLSYGRTDEVKDLFYVTTVCGHGLFAPLIPIRSLLVLSPKAGGGEVPIGWSARSILMIAVLALFIAFGLMALMTGVVLSFGANGAKVQQPQGLIAFAIGAVLIAAAVLLRLRGPFRRAGYQRAVKLAERAKLPTEVMVRIEEHFGRVTPEEASDAIAKMRSTPSAKL